MSLRVIKKPVVTEKSIALANEANAYTFEVDRLANKHQVADAITAIYDVKVVRVRSISQAAHSKKTGRRRMNSSVARTKKCVVTLSKDDRIDLFDTSK